jgi:hypothetical protein
MIYCGLFLYSGFEFYIVDKINLSNLLVLSFVLTLSILFINYNIFWLFILKRSHCKNSVNIMVHMTQCHRCVTKHGTVWSYLEFLTCLYHNIFLQSRIFNFLLIMMVMGKFCFLFLPPLSCYLPNQLRLTFIIKLKII